MVKDFVVGCETDERIPLLRAQISAFAQTFPMPGFDGESVPKHLRSH